MWGQAFWLAAGLWAALLVEHKTPDPNRSAPDGSTPAAGPGTPISGLAFLLLGTPISGLAFLLLGTPISGLAFLFVSIPSHRGAAPIQLATFSRRPYGSATFVRALEMHLGRQKGCRPSKQPEESDRMELWDAGQ